MKKWCCKLMISGRYQICCMLQMKLTSLFFRVRYDQNMNITMKKSRIGMLKTSYSTELSVTSADKSYEGDE